jgi:hypothetical protein
MCLVKMPDHPVFAPYLAGNREPAGDVGVDFVVFDVGEYCGSVVFARRGSVLRLRARAIQKVVG